LPIAVADRLVPESAGRLRKARSRVKLLALHSAQRLPGKQVMDLLRRDLDAATDAASQALRDEIAAGRFPRDRRARTSGTRRALSP
jgi:hypothetical protein